jgi:hypothetical protein
MSTEPAAASRPRILYVDDQQGNLVVFKATFKKYLDVVTASSAKEALGRPSGSSRRRSSRSSSAISAWAR